MRNVHLQREVNMEARIGNLLHYARTGGIYAIGRGQMEGYYCEIVSSKYNNDKFYVCLKDAVGDFVLPTTILDLSETILLLSELRKIKWYNQYDCSL